MTSKPGPTPEGELISTVLRTRTGLSARKAAEEAGISEGRWRQIVSGYQIPAKGTYVEVIGPADTVAAMARVAQVTPAELADAGREDAAQILRSTPPPPQEVVAVSQWEEEIRAPSPPLLGEEVLMWRHTSTGRRYRLEIPSEEVSVEHTFEPHEAPGEVIEDLRDLLEQHRVSAQQMGRRRARR